VFREEVERRKLKVEGKPELKRFFVHGSGEWREKSVFPESAQWGGRQDKDWKAATAPPHAVVTETVRSPLNGNGLRVELSGRLGVVGGPGAAQAGMPPRVFCVKSLEDDENARVKFSRAAKEFVRVSKQKGKGSFGACDDAWGKGKGIGAESFSGEG